jgi:hypothetical protein
MHQASRTNPTQTDMWGNKTNLVFGARSKWTLFVSEIDREMLLGKTNQIKLANPLWSRTHKSNQATWYLHLNQTKLMMTKTVVLGLWFLISYPLLHLESSQCSWIRSCARSSSNPFISTPSAVTMCSSMPCMMVHAWHSQLHLGRSLTAPVPCSFRTKLNMHHLSKSPFGAAAMVQLPSPSRFFG